MKIRPELMNIVSLEFSSLAKQKVKNAERIISLGLGEPGFPTPLPIIEATHKAMLDGFTRYSIAPGLLELREKIASKLDRDNNIVANPEDIIVTPGAKQALSLALTAILRPGDEVLNIFPCFVSYVPQIVMAEPDVVIRTVDLQRKDFSLDVAALRELISERTRAIVVNFPHNPTGRMLSQSDWNALADLVDEKDIYVLSDEIYDRLNFSGQKHLSPASHEALKHKTVTINGFSKAFSMTGWRIGYLHAPAHLSRTICQIHQHLNTHTATFIQKGASAALDLPESYVESQNIRLRTNADLLVAMLEACDNAYLYAPQGGLFAFVDISRTGIDSDTFATRLLAEKGVALTPGKVFGEAWDSHIRVSLAPDCDSFAEGTKLLVEFLGELESQR